MSVELETMDVGAELSKEREYRYRLWRIWDRDLPLVLFIGLNPSTANEAEDDPTIRRCVGFAKHWNYGGVLVGNLFALRATDPKVMMKHPEPIGPGNNKALTEMFWQARISVACWGAHGGHQNRDSRVASMHTDLKCLGITKTGHPRHPLYLRRDTELINWRGR